jgi:CIC family chloride channel protein
LTVPRRAADDRADPEASGETMTSSATEHPTALRHRSLVLALRMRARILARHRIRNNDLGLVVTAAAIGIGVGLGVAVVREIVFAIHTLLYGIDFEAHLSGTAPIGPWRIVLVPTLGGLAYGAIATLLRRWRPRDIVDAVEANALFGGRMSLADSLRLTLLTILSAGVGASIGLEAAYTQLGAGTASWVGQALRLRRSDLRTFVGCGAAAAIAAVFNAPLAGAFYAFELIIGSYTMATLAPVGIAALAGVLVERQLFGGDPIFVVYEHVELFAADYLALAFLGVAAAGLGIAAMIGVTMVETWGRRVALPATWRPAVGGTVLALMALIYPEVLGSGHGGIETVVATGFPFPLLVGLIVAKTAGSAISIGSGFRGGMFSSSLFIGGLFGSAFGIVAVHLLPALTFHSTVFVLAGMGAVAAAIVGAPITMILLVLEATSDFSATIGVTVSVILAAFTVRHSFGYSFATWRFHVRGVGLHGAHDIGWLQDLTVARVMRRDVATAAKDLPLKMLRELFPTGATKTVFLVDQDGAYAGLVDTHEAHSADLDATIDTQTAADIAHAPANFLRPEQSIRVALDLFVAAESEALAVVDSGTSRRVIGYLTEAYALRRYNRELEERRGEELGDSDLFWPSQAPGRE